MSDQAPLVVAERISKRYGGARALTEADLSLVAGEVHCLVGENGAGKSTLGKVIAGVVRPDEGVLRVDGRVVEHRGPRDALAVGVTIVEQELALVPAMSVAHNVMLGLPRARRPRTVVRALAQEHGLELDVDCPVERLSVADQQKTEILRALARRARVIVMDEPTARLDRRESQALLTIIRGLAAGGTTVVYVSHFLEEVVAVADRITVLRNGRVVQTADAAGQTPGDLVSSMLGRAARLEFPPKAPPPADAPFVLDAKALGGAGVSGVDLQVRRGEIVGLAGLVGSGRTEVARLLYGADPLSTGSVHIDGEPLKARRPRDAIRRGVAYLPESRKDLGLFLELSNEQNVTLPHLDDVCRAGLISPASERSAAHTMLERLGVAPPLPEARTGGLSGGNQQKVLFAKWLRHAPRLLIADEPTRGVDVGAKFAIYELLVSLAAEGMAILLISSELDEVVGLAHRVVVLSRGRSVATVGRADISEDRILRAAFAQAPAERDPLQKAVRA